MSSLLDGIDTSGAGTGKRAGASDAGMSNTTKGIIAGLALLLAGAIFFWQFGSSSQDQTKLSSADAEVSEKLAKEEAARRAAKPGQAAPAPAFNPSGGQSFKR